MSNLSHSSSIQASVRVNEAVQMRDDELRETKKEISYLRDVLTKFILSKEKNKGKQSVGSHKRKKNMMYPL